MKNKIIFTVILGVLFMLIGCNNQISQQLIGASRTYYINSIRGSDNNSGTLESPWKTLKKISKHKFAAGDTVFFARNSNFKGGFVISSSGKPGKPIVFTAYGKGSAPSFTNSDYGHLNGNVFQIAGSYVIIDGLSFKNCAGSGSKVNKKILLVGAVYSITGADHLIVRNSEFEDCPIGIHINSQYCLITNNNLHDCNRFLAEPDWGPIAIFIANANNEISYNTCSNYIKVGGNYGADGGFLELDARFFGNNVHDIKVHHNKSFDNMGFMEVEKSANGDNLDVYYNLSDDYQEFIFYWGGNNSKIENNTIIRTKPSKNGAVNTVFTMTEGNFTLRNNIFLVANGVQVLITAPYDVGNYDNVIHENNLYYCTDGSTFNPCGKQLGKGEIIADPLFIDLQNRDFHLKASSPAIDAGVNLSYKKDFDDNPIPSGAAPDMGAYEYQSK